MFESLEKVIRELGVLTVMEERYGDGILVGIDFETHINYSVLDDDGSWVSLTGNEIHNAIDAAISPGDMEAMKALDKLCEYAERHPCFLFAKGKTFAEAMNELEERASILLINLDYEQYAQILLGFVKYVPELWRGWS